MGNGVAEIAHGPMFIGFMFNILLFGIMITQVYIYFTAYKNDSLRLKLFVLLLFIADILNSVFIAIYLYRSLIINFADPRSLEKADWIFATDPAITAIIASLVQLFFAWRVKVLSKNLWLVGAILACAIAGGVGGIITAVEVVRIPKFVDFQMFQNVVALWLSAECAGDILITGSLVWHLKKNKTGFRHSDVIVERIIRLTVQTGLLTCLCATLDLIFFLTDPTGTHLIFNFPLSKLYTNTLMSSLNSRGNRNTNGANHPVNLISSKSSQGTPYPPDLSKLSPTDSAREKFNRDTQQVYIHVESHRLQDMNGTRRTSSESAMDKTMPQITPDTQSEAAPWEYSEGVKNNSQSCAV